MPIIVQKFGGTSVADSQKILAAARKAIRAQQQGQQVVMVVSAMGHTTDMLVDLAEQITDRPAAREMDMLLSTGEQVSVALMAMAIQSLGAKAVSLTGAQIGIKTDSKHTKARIRSISTERMQELLDEGNIVIAAGFQGIDEDYNITTLGRGGSDTTAVALAAVLRADACEIYTDVDGVYTTDPRLMPEARKVGQISYDEMLELASLGAGVMHNRSIEFARKFHVPIHVRSSFSDVTGSMIVADPESVQQPVCGAAMTREEARVTVLGLPDVPGTSYEIFSRIAEKNISVDMIVQNIGQQGRADLSFTVPRKELPVTLEAVQEAARIVGAAAVTHDENVAKISVVGIGMARQTGVAQKMFRALANESINIQMITTSQIKISALVQRDQSLSALRAVHQAFQLETEPQDAAGKWVPKPPEEADAAVVATRLQGANMEELTIEDITLDQTQARITINGIPDKPGVAAKIFEDVAAAGIFVDLIVQSYNGRSNEASLSFTVPQQKLKDAVSTANSLAKALGCTSVTSSPQVALLDVSGVGLRSHTGVGVRMFHALAEQSINVEMISTSEVRVTVVVNGLDGENARTCLMKAFSDAMR